MEFNSLLVALCVVGIYIVWRENKHWEVIYEGNSQYVYSRFAYLKSKGIHCKIKTITPKDASTLVNPSMQSTVKLLVSKKDVEKAYHILSNFNER